MNEYKVRTFANTGISSNLPGAPTSSVDNASSMRELDRRLDQALEDTFPASDPLSIVMPHSQRVMPISEPRQRVVMRLHPLSRCRP
jgi:hypothetical protein